MFRLRQSSFVGDLPLQENQAATFRREGEGPCASVWIPFRHQQSQKFAFIDASCRRGLYDETTYGTIPTSNITKAAPETWLCSSLPQ